MKKFIICFVCLLFVFLSIFTFKSALFAEENKSSGYAVISSQNCYLYRTPTLSESYINKFFLLEESYFVKVLDQPNDEFYQVEYMNIIGYVKTECIDFVIETPINPYLDYVTLDLNSKQDVPLLKSPNGKYDDFNILYPLPSNTKNLVYLGKISAVEQEAYMGNIWYFCTYFIDANTQATGYIYAPYCCNISPINKNSEVLTATSLSSFASSISLFNLSLSTENLVIVFTTIPALAFVLILSFPRKNNKAINYETE